MNVIWGLIGIFIVLGIAFLLSSSHRSIKWRTILAGLLIQLLFAFIVLEWGFGRKVLASVSNAVSQLISYANEGINFLFGALANSDSMGTVFAIHVLTIIIFFSAFCPLLFRNYANCYSYYRWGIIVDSWNE